MVVGIYIRVSTLEQAEEGYSVPAQKERLIAYCKAQGWDEYKLYVDEGISGKSTDRPKLQFLMDDVKTGKIKMILVYRLDRFTRSVRDLHTMLDILENYNCKFRSATEMYDTSTAMGRMFIGLVALLAQWETENMSERIIFALDKKVSDGEHVGVVPYGFKSVDERLLIEPDEGKFIMDMIDKLEKGWSASRIADYMALINDDRLWVHATVIRILRNPALCGHTRWKDKLYKNTHKGYITEDHFEKVQSILDDRSQTPRKNVESTYLFQGVLACSNCGKTLSVNRFFYEQKDGSKKQGAMYRCAPCAKNKAEVRNLGELKYKEALIEYMKVVTFNNIEVVEPKNNELEELTNQLNKIKNRREKYQRAWASDKMTDEEFDKLMDETKEFYEELQNKISEIKPVKKMDVESLKNLVFTFNQLFSGLDIEKQQEFVQRFIRKIYFRYVEHPPSKLSRNPKKGQATVEILEVEFY
ncbi:recombinase family protein [Psychrobacillus lasiicapitis]|uniref:Recombinase family protein n=1 Tax=Psychrobacillus lasiicapitis TaxID=1636719 RepID=A0A544TAE2_9BACI|nr:recombinase family protein [Psychrobacillus lasiicapitis]TQR14356.1 recombinase family protein [Psychrobacillus lasiicapitis]GGA32064.1 integrase [Psychrobacillus lasiicapitis]